MLKFREHHAINFLLILLFTFFFINAFPQSIQENSLKKESAEILEKNISIQWHGGPLPELLKELSARENLNIAYSREKTKHLIINNQDFNSEKLSSILTRIFNNTGYTYIVIGKTIAIVEDKKEAPAETKAVQDSVSAPSAPAAPENKKEVNSHIYPETPVGSRLPYHIRRELRKIYRQELSLARKHTEDSTEQHSASDSLRKRQAGPAHILKSRIFISASTGLSLYHISYYSDFKKWEELLDFKSENSNSFCTNISGGVSFNHFMLETGIGYNKIKIKNSYVENPKTLKMINFTEVYTVFTIPANILYYRKFNRFLLGGGPGIGLSFIKRTAPKDKMRPYYDRLKGPGAGKELYTESNRSISPGINLKVYAGYELTEQWSLSGNIFLNIPLRAYHTNSVYRIYPYAAGFQLCLSYRFSGR